MDRLDELAIFVRIVEEGSLARAASRLRRSPPAVTRALASLEGRLGVRLIDRTTRRLAPTEAGRLLHERARVLLGDYEAATLGVREAPVRGLLRIAAPVQFGRRHVAPIVVAFLDVHPDVEIELMLNDRNVDLIDDSIDVAVRIGALADSGLTAQPVGMLKRLWVASPAYLGRHGTPQTPKDVVDHEAVLGTFRRAQAWTFGSSRRSRGVRVAGRFRVDDVETRLRRWWPDAASAISCRTRWPTSWRPAASSACSAPSSRRRSRCICLPRDEPTGRPRSRRFSGSRRSVCRRCPFSRPGDAAERGQSGETPKRRCQNSRLRFSPTSQPSSYSGRTNLV